MYFYVLQSCYVSARINAVTSISAISHHWLMSAPQMYLSSYSGSSGKLHLQVGTTMTQTRETQQ